MSTAIITLLEDMAHGTIIDYSNYLSSEELQAIRNWYSSYGGSSETTDKEIIGLLYELYIREDIDFRPVDEFQDISSSLAKRYHFENTQFLNMYIRVRELLYGK